MTENETVARYTPLAYRLARGFWFAGADREDVQQEALVALLEAIREYRPGRGSFPVFAKLVIRRHLCTYVRMAQAKKHTPLNEAVREFHEEGMAPIPAGDGLPDPRAEQRVEAREQLRNVFAGLPRLTPLEARSLIGFGCGLTHAELVAQTGTHYKAIDNAYQRGRRKLREAA